MAIFSEKGLLKKNPLRGSSLANRFASMAAEAGVSGLYTQPVGLSDAASKVSAYATELGKGVPDLRQAAKESEQKLIEAKEGFERAREEKQFNRQKSRELQVSFSQYNPKFMARYGGASPAPDQLAKLRQRQQQYQRAAQAATQDVQEYKTIIDEQENTLKTQQAELDKRREKQSKFAAFKNFTTAYAKAVADGANRDTFLSSVHGLIGPPPEAISELHSIRGKYVKLQEDIAKAREVERIHRERAASGFEKIKNIRQQNLWDRKVRKYGGPIYRWTGEARFTGITPTTERLRGLSMKRREAAGVAGAKKAGLLGEAAAERRRAAKLEHEVGLRRAGAEFIL
jgi:hypothetical protein